MSSQEVRDKAVAMVTKEWMDKGRIVEAGWAAYRIVVLPPDAGPVQISETRKAFFAGAQHLFSSIMVGLDDDHEPTVDDLTKMDRLDAELREFARQLTLDVAKPAGSA